MAVEAGTDKAEFWTKSGGLLFGKKKKLKELVGNLAGDKFPGLFFDGRVRWISTSIDSDTLRSLIQHNDGVRFK